MAHNRNGSLPDPEVLKQGPFVHSDTIDQSTDLGALPPIVELNRPYLDMIFQLMPAVVGVQIWRGQSRCGRDPAYQLNDVTVGGFQEMVTPSDQVFMVWAYENFYNDVVDDTKVPMVANDKDNIILKKVRGKWTQQGSTDKYGGWKHEGKLAYNRLMKQIKAQMGTSLHMRVAVEPRGHRDVGAVDHFKAAFEQRWRETNGIFVQEVSNSGGSNEGGEEEDDDVGVEFGDLAVDLIYQGSRRGSNNSNHGAPAPDSQLTNASGLDSYHPSSGAEDNDSATSDEQENIY